MRPGLHGNLLRHSRQRSRRLNNRPHTFSLSRLLMMVFVGAIMFIPGITLTVIGLQKAALKELAPPERIMYKVVGPSMCVLGLGTLLASGIYYCCYAVGDDPKRKGNSHHAVLVSQNSERNDHHHHHGEHHHDVNGSATPERRGSYSRNEENRVPLAYIDEEPLAPVAIQIDNVPPEAQRLTGLDIPEVRISPCSSYQGSILNGEIQSTT